MFGKKAPGAQTTQGKLSSVKRGLGHRGTFEQRGFLDEDEVYYQEPSSAQAAFPEWPTSTSSSQAAFPDWPASTTSSQSSWPAATMEGAGATSWPSTPATGAPWPSVESLPQVGASWPEPIKAGQRADGLTIEVPLEDVPLEEEAPAGGAPSSGMCSAKFPTMKEMITPLAAMNPLRRTPTNGDEAPRPTLLGSRRLHAKSQSIPWGFTKKNQLPDEPAEQQASKLE